MAKLTLDDLTSLSNETSVVNTTNENNAAIEAALENTLSRDGTSPNQMEYDLDMNSNRILNLPYALTNTEPVTLGQFSSFEGFADSVTLAAALAAAAAAQTAAETAQAAAEAAQAAAEAAYDDFDDRYLGPLASEPTLDNDGDALTDGALYFNTTTNDMWVYDLGTTSWGVFNTATVSDNSVTLAKMEHGTQGEILYYGTSGEPFRLPAGTSGQYLKTNGGGADPTWATVSTDAGNLIDSWTYSSPVSEVDFTGLAGYTQLKIIFYDITSSSSGGVALQVSTDNGSTFKSTATSYYSGYLNNGGDGFSTGSYIADADTTTGKKSGDFTVTGLNSASIKTTVDGRFAYSGHVHVVHGYRDVAEVNNAIRIKSTAGNFTAGSIFVFGLLGT